MFPNSPTCTMELHAYGIQYDAVRALASIRAIAESMYVHCRPSVIFFLRNTARDLFVFSVTQRGRADTTFLNDVLR